MNNFKKGLLWIIVFLCLINSASALLTDDIMAYYPEDNNTRSGTTSIDIHSGINGTIQGNPTYPTGIINESYELDGTGDYVILNNTDFDVDGGDLSISLWVNSDNEAQQQGMISKQTNGATLGWYFDKLATHKLRLAIGVDGTHYKYCDTTTYTLPTVLTHVVGVIDGGLDSLSIWVNGTNQTVSCSNVGAVGDYDANVNVLIGDNPNRDEFNGGVDEVGIWNRTLSSSEISELYASHSGLPYGNFTPPSPSITINWTYPPNTDNQYNIINLTFNSTVNWSNTYNQVNCSLYENGTINQTVNDVSNISATLINVTYDSNLETSYSYYIFCENNETNVTSPTRIVHIDNVNPIITTNFVNNSFFNGDNMTGQFNFSDTFYLQSYNITIDGSIIRNITDINSTFTQYNLSYDIYNLTPGPHNLSIRLADGHTAKGLGGDYEISDGLFNDYLKYDFWDKGSVMIKGLPDSIFDEFTTERKSDRYTFTYEPSDMSESYSFEIVSDMKIHIVNKPDSKYKKWLIMGDHWMDFYMPNEPNQQIEIERVNDYKVIVTITGLEFPEFQEYASIGDLNIVTQNFTVFATTMTVTYQDSVSELQEQTITYMINTSGISYNSTNALFYYNGTNMNVTKTSGADYDLYTSTFITPSVSASTNISFYWNYTFTGIVNVETGNLPFNQTVYRVGIDNCSTYTTQALNITLRNESDNNLVISELDGHFRAWVSDMGDYRAFNLSWSPSTNFTICIDPSNATYYVYGQLEYGATGFNTETYYFSNITLDNVTDYLTFYLTDGATATTFIVTDENDNAVQNVYISILTYDLPTDSFVTTEILQTDSNGAAIGYIVQNTQWYRFILTYNSEIVLETSAMKVTTTPWYFQINLLGDYFDSYNIVQGVSCLVTYNNNTNTFSYTYSDPSGNVAQGCLEIVRREIVSDTTINESCTSSSSSTILLIPSNMTNNTYIGYGTIFIEGIEFGCAMESISLDEGYRVYGTAGLFVSFLIILTLSMVGIWNPAVAVVLMMIGIIITNILGLFHLNWGYLIGFIILGGITIYRLRK